MSAETLIVWLLVGAIAGWLAGVIVKGYGFGLIGNIVVGIIGSFVGGWIFTQTGIGLGGGIFGAIAGATLGAVVLLFLLRLVRRAAWCAPTPTGSFMSFRLAGIEEAHDQIYQDRFGADPRLNRCRMHGGLR
jgi:uncharacterized membrane protein YeaQ/YmgE (transglycosylase-associated protein family)